MNKSVQFQNIDLPPVRYNFQPSIPKIENPALEEQKHTNKNLEAIRYENIKSNAQIVRGTIKSDNEELDELRTANSKLEAVNRTLIENNRHNWRNTFLVSLIVGIILFILGLYSTEVKSLLQSLLIS